MEINLIKLSKSQLKLLKKIAKSPIYPQNKPFSNDFELLLHQKLIQQNNKLDSFYNNVNPTFCISEKGILFISYNKDNNKRFWIPTIISIVAVTISVIALIKSFLF
ncbi:MULTISPECIES: hypothetical protein [Helcococcus]|uniref:Uncharacterized protein n=1 Tax=Helcococcus bovis TaxID=3153252 RepID=A0ABW9F8F1_9FIRM